MMKQKIAQQLGACITGAVLTFIGMGAFILLHPESRSGEEGEYRGTQFVSRGISYQYDEGNKGYIFNLDGKKTLKGVSWISKPLGDDSLVCFSNGEKRGYFNMFTGELAIKPKYRHAWVFSDGLAAVEVDNRIQFIDPTGKVVIDNDIPYKPRHNGYVFHHGYCVVHDKQGEKVGMIDKKGNWAVKPEYLFIELKDSFWVLSKNQHTAAVLSSNLDMVVPFTEAKFFVDNGLIEAHMSDHTVRTYSPSGELLDDFHISEVTQLIYDTNEVYYDTTKDYNYREIDYEERMVSESEQEQLSVRQAVARCRCYQAEYGWYGLMTPDGRVVTPPSYSSITAIGPDLYFCKYSESQGVILDGKGQRVR